MTAQNKEDKPRRKYDKRVSSKAGIKPSRRPTSELATQSNQWVAAPKQKAFVRAYYSLRSPTRGNVKESAISVGYSENYAKKLSEHIRKGHLDWLTKFVATTKDDVIQELSALLNETSEIEDSHKRIAEARKIMNDIGEFAGHKVQKTETRQEIITIKLDKTDINRGETLE